MIDYYKWKGLFYIEVKEHEKIIDKIIEKNIIVDNIYNEMLGAVSGLSIDLEIKYLAFGDDSTMAVGTNEHIGNEFFRVPVTAGPARTDTGEYTTDFFLAKDEGNGNTIRELGIYVGSEATNVSYSGKLMARVVLSSGIEKTSSKELTIRRVDRLYRA